MDDVPGGKNSVRVIGKWEKAYAEQMHDAAVGRLFRGIIHNLNGVVQAFSMQSELFELMFRQSDHFFSLIFNGTDTEKNEAMENLYTLLQKRAVLADQMSEKTGICQKIVQRTLSLSRPFTASDSNNYLLGDLIRDEMDFLCADSFFKHKVGKEVVIEEHLTVPAGDIFCLRLALQTVLQNALESLKQGTEGPLVRVAVKRLEKWVALEVTDNGPGFSEDIQRQMFLPFFSTKESHAGLGLYMARKSLEQLGGSITASCHDGSTTFLLQICPSAPSLLNQGG